MDKQDIQFLVRKYALLNAIDHKGRANPGAVVGRLMAENPDLRADSKFISGLARDITSDVNSKSETDQLAEIQRDFPGFIESEYARRKAISEKDSEKKASLPPLPGAKIGDVVTRFPPEPNGFMHIGHAKASIFASEYAKLYSGRFIMRYDDTNPAAEKAEFYSAFLESFEWLGLKPDVVKYASDDMQKFYEIAEKMIIGSKAYVCFCPQQAMRAFRATGESCPHRLNALEKNLESWREMVSGKYPEDYATLRFVGDMHSRNTAMRDPVLFRVVLSEHPRQGTKFKAWPTYDFDGPVEDSIDGVTHAMRSKEYELRDEQYNAVLDALSMRKPIIVEFSRLALQNTTMSKRKLRKLVDEGLVDGWDDPRLPTISALKRRGILPEAIRTFVISMGLSKVESQPTWDYLESINRKLLDPISPRYIFVPEPVLVRVESAPPLEVQIPYHPENDGFGQRTMDASGPFLVPRADLNDLHPGSRMRLIEAYNVKIESVSENEIVATFDGDDQLRDTPKVQWLNAAAANREIEVWIPGPLVIGDEFNPNSLVKLKGLAEPSLGELRMGQIVQFIRFGFCRIDSPTVAILSCK